MKYIVKFNNHVGNTFAKRLEDAMQSANSIVNYKYADMAIIFRIREDGKLSPITYVAR